MGKWGEMQKNGELCEIANSTFWEMYEKGVKLTGNRREIGEKWDHFGQIPHFSQSHFSHFSTASPPFPHVPLMNVAGRTGRLEKWKTCAEPTLADFSANTEACIKAHRPWATTRSSAGDQRIPRAPTPLRRSEAKEDSPPRSDWKANPRQRVGTANCDHRSHSTDGGDAVAMAYGRSRVRRAPTPTRRRALPQQCAHFLKGHMPV